jgi:hypothetical protein
MQVMGEATLEIQRSSSLERRLILPCSYLDLYLSHQVRFGEDAISFGASGVDKHGVHVARPHR